MTHLDYFREQCSLVPTRVKQHIKRFYSDRTIEEQNEIEQYFIKACLRSLQDEYEYSTHKKV